MTVSSDKTSEPLIHATGLGVTLGGTKVLNNIDISLWPREILTLVGLNGSGKSTLVKALGGLIMPDEGAVTRREGLRIGYCPQHAHPDNTLPMSVMDFLQLTQAAPGMDAIGVLEEVGISGLENRQLSALSGGEYQRLLLARAILRKPDVLMLDEPMAGVDVAGQSDLYQLIPQLRDRYGCGVILVSHDIHVVMAATDRVICLNHHVCCSGHPESVAVHPEFVSLFGAQIAETLAVYKHQHDHSHDLHGDTLGEGHEQGDHSYCEHDHA
ncbi:MAG: ATP-binding cassette domain-containing protein [Gammaproteobacteria bacterium]|nr:ATP-binding cassette domain-containing protein [Gammaproteobacteria bacterium]